MLFSMDPARRCIPYEGFLLAPLPLRKQLWEARDENTWMLEKSRDFGDPSVFGVMVGGQMVKLNEPRVGQGSEMAFVQWEKSMDSSANWQEWCSGMDALGALEIG